MRGSWWRQNRSGAAGVALVALSVLATVVAAWQGASGMQSPGFAAFLVVLAAGFQIAAASMFNKQGRSDPALAATAFRSLGVAANKAADARKVAERAAEEDTSVDELRRASSILSTHLSWIEDQLVQAGETWALVHPDLKPERQKGESEKRRTGD